MQKILEQDFLAYNSVTSLYGTPGIFAEPICILTFLSIN